MDAVLGRLRRDRPGGPRGRRRPGLPRRRGADRDRADRGSRRGRRRRGGRRGARWRGGDHGSRRSELGSGDGARRERGARASTAAAEGTDAAAETAAAAAAANPRAPAGGRDLPVAPRIAQNGAITVRAAPADLDHTIDSIGRMAENAGGYVAGTQADLTGPTGKGRAEVTVRVPRNLYATMVERFAGLGSVVARESTSDDLTQDYVDTESRLRHARLVEARLVALLDRAETVNQALAVQARLDDVQLRIETDRGRLDNLTRVTDYATIAVRLVTATPAAAATTVRKAGDDRPWGLRDALDDAAHNLAAPSEPSCAASASRCRSPPSGS